jgi:MFS family permease
MEPATHTSESRLGVLQNRNFTLLWTGSIVSNTGSWMQIVAQAFLVFELSGSPFLLGVVGMARAIPMIILPPFGGVIADRFPRLKLLKVTQVANFFVAFLQGAVVSLGIVTIWQLALLGLFAGMVNAFDNPTRQALLPDLVKREHLNKAIALNSSAWQGSALFGPTLAGVFIAAFGVAEAFYINAFSYLAVLIALYWMRDVPEHNAARSNVTITSDLVAGLKYVRGTSLICVLLAMAAVTSIFGRSFQQLLPVFASDVFHKGGLGLGIMFSAPGAGTLFGASAIAVVRDSQAKGRMFIGGALLFSVLVAWFALNRSFGLSLVLLFGTGVASIVFSSFMTTMIQLEAPDGMRGRVMSLVTVTMQGFTPIGTLLTGALATQVGTPEAVALSALVVGAAALLTLIVSPSVRNYGMTTRSAGSVEVEPVEVVAAAAAGRHPR